MLTTSGDPIGPGTLHWNPRAVSAPWNPLERSEAGTDGRFEVTVTGFGARRFGFCADGFACTGTTVFTDGSDVELEVRFEPKAAGNESQVAYLGPLTDTRRLGELQAGALCRIGTDLCPPVDQVRGLIEDELAATSSTEVRIALWMAYLSLPERTPQVRGREREFAGQLLATLEPTSWRWIESSKALVVATRVTEDQDYFMRAFRDHPDPDFPSDLVLVARAHAEAEGDSATLERLDRLAADPRVTASGLLPLFEGIVRSHERWKYGPRLGDVVPEFAVTTVAGQQLDAEHLPGKLTLIHFWATSCKACKNDFPLFHELIASHGDAGFAIVSFTETEDPEAVDQFRAEQWPMPWDHVVMPSGEQNDRLTNAFDLVGVPTWYLVDENHQVVLTNHHPADSTAKARRAALRDYVLRSLPEPGGSTERPQAGGQLRARL